MTRATTVPPDSGSGLGGAVPSRLGRAATQSGGSASSSQSEEACRDAWYSLANWLRAGRLDRGLSIADIARTTKIQARILEDLESGVTEGLPADVFVRGFIRNYARCVGLSEGEALARYAACSRDAGPVASPAATAIAELYAPTTRRMSTVVPVAPGSPAAEVHAAPGPRYERAATSPGYPRAATSPGMAGLHSQPRMLRAPTESGARISAQMAAVVPQLDGMAVSVTGSGIVSTSGVQVAAAVQASVPASAATPPVAPAGAALASSEAAPVSSSSAIPVVEVVTLAEPARSAAPEWPRGLKASKKKSKNQKRKERNERQARPAAAPVRQRAQTIRPAFENDVYESDDVALSAAPPAEVSSAVQSELVAALPAVEPETVATAIESPAIEASAIESAAIEASGLEARPLEFSAASDAGESVIDAPAEVWIPKMPAPRPSRAFVAPTLTIDDADPESASVLQDDRARDREGRDPTRRTFLPPILLESQDRANRQGGLTLAVIILLIAATLTLSYLMRRPSSGGGGMTSLDAPIVLIG